MTSEERMIRVTYEQFQKDSGGEGSHSPAMWKFMWQKLEPAPPTEPGVYIHKDGRWIFACWEKDLMDYIQNAPPKDFLPWCCDKDGICNAVHYMSETNPEWKPKCWDDCPYRNRA